MEEGGGEENPPTHTHTHTHTHKKQENNNQFAINR